MALIGPRPLVEKEVEVNYPDNKDLLLSLKPGLTGYWQAYARNNVGYENGQRQRIGDSWKGDFFTPIISGWKAVHYFTGKKGKSILDCVVKNNCNKNYFENLGFSVLGPILYDFSLWLGEKTKNMDTLLFLSRDGYIMKKAYEKLKNKVSSYVYVSRLSLTTATIWMHPEFEDIKEIMVLPYQICANYLLFGLSSILLLAW